MKKRMKLPALAAALAVVFTMSLAGCSNADPVGLVKANLDYLCTGEITDELLEQANGQSEADLKALYKSDVDEAVDALVDALDCETYATAEKRAVVEAFVKKAISKAKYEVGEEYTEEDGVYHVKVTVYPMDFLQTANDYVEGEFTQAWEAKIRDGSYTYTTDEQLMVDMYDELFAYFMESIDQTGYLDGVEMDVAVEEKDGVLSPNEDDLAAAIAAMIGE